MRIGKATLRCCRHHVAIGSVRERAGREQARAMQCAKVGATAGRRVDVRMVVRATVGRTRAGMRACVRLGRGTDEVLLDRVCCSFGGPMGSQS